MQGHHPTPQGSQPSPSGNAWGLKAQLLDPLIKRRWRIWHQGQIWPTNLIQYRPQRICVCPNLAAQQRRFQVHPSGQVGNKDAAKKIKYCSSVVLCAIGQRDKIWSHEPVVGCRTRRRAQLICLYPPVQCAPNVANTCWRLSSKELPTDFDPHWRDVLRDDSQKFKTSPREVPDQGVSAKAATHWPPHWKPLPWPLDVSNLSGCFKIWKVYVIYDCLDDASSAAKELVNLQHPSGSSQSAPDENQPLIKTLEC